MPASKIIDGAGWRAVREAVGTGTVGAGWVCSRRDGDGMAAGLGAAGESGPGWRWHSRASAGDEGERICRARTDVSGVPTSHLPTSGHAAPARWVPEAMAAPTSQLHLPWRSCRKCSSCSAAVLQAQLNHPGGRWARLAL